MKIREIVLFAVLLLCAQESMALSPVTFGIKAGVGVQNVDMDDTRLGIYALSAKPQMGFHAGFTSRVNLGVCRLLSEMLYAHNSYRMTAVPVFPEQFSTTIPFPDPAEITSTVRLNSIQIPVLVETNLMRLHFQAGPVFNVWNEGSISDGRGDVLYKRASVGYMLGVGVGLGRWSVTGRYNGDFTRPMQAITIQDPISKQNQTVEVKTPMQTWMVSIEFNL